jgi:hypothetical protein
VEFYEFPSSYDCGRRQGFSGSPDEFFRYAERQMRRQKMDGHQREVELSRYRAEEVWLQFGRPYFKIWAGVIPLLANIGLEVPPTYLRLPFPAFVLRFPTDDNFLRIDENYQVRSIMVIECKSADGQRNVMLWTDIGERLPNSWPLLHWSRLICRPDRTIEEAFSGKAMPDLPGASVPDRVKCLCLRIAVSVCFLATGMDRLVEPDVLSKDLAAYCAAQNRGDEHRIKSIQARAVRRGKKGWNVGKYERLRSLTSRSASDADGSTSRGALTHQHQRRAHFRLLPSGKVVFVRQATVRPDLPPPAFAPGYGLR